jgi:hypothetical protein
MSGTADGSGRIAGEHPTLIELRVYRSLERWPDRTSFLSDPSIQGISAHVRVCEECTEVLPLLMPEDPDDLREEFRLRVLGSLKPPKKGRARRPRIRKVQLPLRFPFAAPDDEVMDPGMRTMAAASGGSVAYAEGSDLSTAVRLEHDVDGSIQLWFPAQLAGTIWTLRAELFGRSSTVAGGRVPDLAGNIQHAVRISSADLADARKRGADLALLVTGPSDE